jgi:diadenosine tetraphosphate (Ap4A) HIT family hydrolase
MKRCLRLWWISWRNAADNSGKPVDMTECPFCERLARAEIVAENELAAAINDAYPVSSGHTLIVPRRHVESFLDMTHEEQASVWALVEPVRRNIEKDNSPDGYNIGVNIGAAAGQTIPHAHLHVIPRYAGDVKDPRGGIRWVIRSHAPYWKKQ